MVAYHIYIYSAYGKSVPNFGSSLSHKVHDFGLLHPNAIKKEYYDNY